MIKGEKLSVLVHEQSMTRAEKDDQHTQTVNDDIPESPPEPLSPPNEPTQQLNKPPSIELKGREN